MVTKRWPCCFGLSVDERKGAMILKFRGWVASGTLLFSCDPGEEKKGDLIAWAARRGGAQMVLHKLPGAEQ